MGLKAGACYGLALFFCPCHFPFVLLAAFVVAGAAGWWAGSFLLAFIISLVLSGGFAGAGWLLNRRERRKQGREAGKLGAPAPGLPLRGD